MNPRDDESKPNTMYLTVSTVGSHSLVGALASASELHGLDRDHYKGKTLLFLITKFDRDTDPRDEVNEVIRYCSPSRVLFQFQ